MPSTTATQALTNAFSGEPVITLLEISSPELTDVGRFASYDQDISHQGNTYIAYPFEPVFPNTDSDTPTKASIQIDNVHRDITLLVRALQEPPTVTIKIILANFPDDVIAEWDNLQIISVEGNASTITAEISVEDFDSEPVPAYSFVPAYFHAII